jgi:hypothetical protein
MTEEQIHAAIDAAEPRRASHYMEQLLKAGFTANPLLKDYNEQEAKDIDLSNEKLN